MQWCGLFPTPHTPPTPAPPHPHPTPLAIWVGWAIVPHYLSVPFCRGHFIPTTCLPTQPCSQDFLEQVDTLPPPHRFPPPMVPCPNLAPPCRTDFFPHFPHLPTPHLQALPCCVPGDIRVACRTTPPQPRMTDDGPHRNPPLAGGHYPHPVSPAGVP